MTNTINNANINGLLNAGNNNNSNRTNPLHATSHSNHNRHHFRNNNPSSQLDNFSALFEPPVPINFNSSGSNSSSSNSSASSYWPAPSSVHTNDNELQSETTAERLEHNSHKFHKTPYRDDNCKNEWLIEILGPTNILRSSSPGTNIPLNETANANLLNPKSPTTSLANRSNARLPNRNNNNIASLNSQSASNLNSLSNPLLVSQNVSSNPSHLGRTSTSSLQNQNTSSNAKFNSHFPTATQTKKNTSPPVVPGHVKPQIKPSMHHSASASTLPVHKYPPTHQQQHHRNSNDLLKVFKQMQLKPFINRLEDSPILVSNNDTISTTTTTAITTTITPVPEPTKAKVVNNRSSAVTFDLLLSEDDADDSMNSLPTPKTYKQPLSSSSAKHQQQLQQQNSESSNNGQSKTVEKKPAQIANDKASTNDNNLNNNANNSSVYMRPSSGEVKPLNSSLIRSSASRTPTPTPVAAVPAQKQLIAPNENQSHENDKTVKTSSLDDSSSSSSSDDEDSDSSSSSSSSSNGSSSSSDSDDDSSSSSSSSSSEGECSSSSNESDTTSKPALSSGTTSLKKPKLTSKKPVDPTASLSLAPPPGTKLPSASIKPSHTHNHHHHHHSHPHHHRPPKAHNNPELDNNTLAQKLSNVTSNNNNNNNSSKSFQPAKINLNKEDLSLTSIVTPAAATATASAREETSEKTVAELDDGEISDNEEDDGNNINDEDDSHNLTLTEMIEKIVSPNKKATSSSSSSSSNNTSPQLPIFSSVASDSAQLVPKAAYSLELHHKPQQHVQAANSANPSPYMDMMEEASEEAAGGKITFTLSDDEIGEDSNASNHNMQNVLTFQQGDDSRKATPVEKEEETKAAGCLPAVGEQTVDNSVKQEGLLDDNAVSKCKGRSSITIAKREQSSTPDVGGEASLLATSSNTKLAVTGENFKQPKLENVSSLKSAKASLSPNQQQLNGPLSAGFEPSKTFQSELNSTSPGSFKDKPTTPPILANKSSPVKQQQPPPAADQKPVTNKQPTSSAPVKSIAKSESANNSKKQPKSKRLISDSSSSEDEESNDDEFKDELGQYLKKKRPLDSGDDLLSAAKPLDNDHNTKKLAKSSTPSSGKQNRAGSNSIVTPTLTTAPTTPALVETAPTPNPKPLKAQHATSRLQGLANGVTKATNKAIDEYDALNELIMRKGSDKLDEEFELFNRVNEKTNRLMANSTPNNLRDTTGAYNQLLVNHAQFHKNGLTENQFKQQQQTTNSSASNPAITGDQIQYTPDGRPKLIVSIELDLIKILNTQFGMQPLNGQYMDTGLQQQQQQELNDLDRVGRKQLQTKPLSDSDELLAKEKNSRKGRELQSKSNKAAGESRKSMVDSSGPTKDSSKSSTGMKDQSRSSESLGNTSLSMKRSGEDLETNQRVATKKPKTVESGKVSADSASASLDSAAATLKMRNKTASFSNVAAAAKSAQLAGDGGRATGGLVGGGSSKSKSQSNILAVGGGGEEAKKRMVNSVDKYGQFTLDFSSLEEQELHRRGKQKKHEADQEKDKYKKSIAYMEAVCYFCLCAISQYRLKKAAVNPSSNKSSFDLLNDTYLLLKYLQEKVLKSIDNDVFIRKFKVLSSWMETFINRWLWLMSLNDIRKLKESIAKQQSLALANSSSNHAAKSAENNPKTVLTSPNELPPPSPASSIGSSAGSLTGNNNTASANVNANTASSGDQQQAQFEIMQKTMSLYERYTKLNEYNFRSQNFWDSNELQINEIDYLNEFRETIKKQVQKELHIDCEAELFASYIITGLQLFRLNF